MAVGDYTQALVYAVPKWINFPEVRDQGFFNAPILKAFKAKGMWKEEETAKELLATIQYAASQFQVVVDPTSSSYMDLTGSGAGDSAANTMTNAKYPWWTKYGRLIIPEPQVKMLANDRNRANQYILNNMKTFMRSWGQRLEEDMLGLQSGGHIDPLSGGAANKPWGDTTRPANLLYWVDGAIQGSGYYPYDNTIPQQRAVDTYKPPGDIDRSTSLNSYWNATHVRPASAEALTFQRAVYPMLLISAKGEPMPDLIITNVAAFAYFQNTLIAAQQWVDVETADRKANVGFLAIRILNALAFPHEKFDHISSLNGSNGSQTNAGRNTILYLNSQSLALFAEKEIKATPVELPHPVMFWKTTRAVGMWADNFRCMGKYTNWYV